MKRLLLLSLFLLPGFPGLAQHTIVMKTGEKRNGVVMEIKHDTLGAIIDGNWTRIPLVNISSIFFDEHVAYNGSFDPDEPEKAIRSGDYIITYVMKDRVMTEAPVISNATENHGTVVVAVTIDRYGNVLKAKPGITGSTTAIKYLLIKAEFAARGARFNEHPTGPVKTRGTISIAY